MPQANNPYDGVASMRCEQPFNDQRPAPALPRSITDAIDAAVRAIAAIGGQPNVMHVTRRVAIRLRVAERFRIYCAAHGIMDTQLLWHWINGQRRRGVHWWPQLLRRVGGHYWNRWMPFRLVWHRIWADDMVVASDGWWAGITILHWPNGPMRAGIDVHWYSAVSGVRPPWRWVHVARWDHRWAVYVAMIEQLQLSIWRD